MKTMLLIAAVWLALDGLAVALLAWRGVRRRRADRARSPAPTRSSPCGQPHSAEGA